MELKLTKEQINHIKDRLKENLIEEQELRIKDKVKDSVCGWDFVHLSNERYELEHIIKNGYIEI